MNNHAFDDNGDDEVVVDPHSAFGKHLADTTPGSPMDDPLELLIALESEFIERTGMTFFQFSAGVRKR